MINRINYRWSIKDNDYRKYNLELSEIQITLIKMMLERLGKYGYPGYQKDRDDLYDKICEIYFNRSKQSSNLRFIFKNK